MATIDATNLVLGRMCTVLAKRALLGEKIEIVNCEKTLISGARKFTIQKYVDHIHRGTPFNGPFFPKQAERIVKRTIRGMLPYRKEHGENALNRVICYKGVPVKLKDAKKETIANANVKSTNNLKYIKLADLSKLIGGK